MLAHRLSRVPCIPPTSAHVSPSTSPELTNIAHSSPDCNHRGECVVVTEGTTDTVKCQCAPGWTGPDCSQGTLGSTPSRCDEVQFSSSEIESMRVRCVCAAACAVGSTECSGHGKCVDVGLDPPRCVCSAGWTGPNCSVALTDCTTGMTPHCLECAGNGTAQYCTSCQADWRGADCNTRTPPPKLSPFSSRVLCRRHTSTSL